MLAMLPAAAAAARQVDSPAGGGWTRQESGTIADLVAVAFTDRSHGWAVGDHGTIVATADGGLVWRSQASGTTQLLTDVSFADGTHGCAVGVGGTILTTDDGGVTWTPRQSLTNEWLAGVCLVDALHGWTVSGDSDLVLSTNDGGRTWDPVNVAIRPLRDVHFIDADRGWVLSQGDGIAATADGGRTWITADLPLTAFCFTVWFTDGRHGWVAGWTPPGEQTPNGAGVVFRTVDGGATWDTAFTGLSLQTGAVRFVDPSRGWLAGPEGTMLSSTDGGETWLPQDSGTTKYLSDVAFADATHGWAVGGGGVIVATRSGGHPDATPPVTTAAGADGLWHRSPVTITFSAVDDDGGSGMTGGAAKTEYRVDGGSWQQGTTCVVLAMADHSNDGVRTVSYRSTDAAGNVETEQSLTVKIDTLGPVTRTRAAKGRAGRPLSLAYRVDDALSSEAVAVRLVVYSASGRRVKTIIIGRCTTNAWHSTRWSPRAKGAYQLFVYGNDLAGNPRVDAGSAIILVR